jgi:hypothetical protein
MHFFRKPDIPRKHHVLILFMAWLVLFLFPISRLFICDYKALGNMIPGSLSNLVAPPFYSTTPNTLPSHGLWTCHIFCLKLSSLDNHITHCLHSYFCSNIPSSDSPSLTSLSISLSLPGLFLSLSCYYLKFHSSSNLTAIVHTL